MSAIGRWARAWWANFRRYWPWWVALYWLLGYELAAVWASPVTLSRLAWRAQVAAPAVAWISSAAVVVLLVHFWLRNRIKRGR